MLLDLTFATYRRDAESECQIQNPTGSRCDCSQLHRDLIPLMEHDLFGKPDHASEAHICRRLLIPIIRNGSCRGGMRMPELGHEPLANQASSNISQALFAGLLKSGGTKVPLPGRSGFFRRCGFSATALKEHHNFPESVVDQRDLS